MRKKKKKKADLYAMSCRVHMPVLSLPKFFCPGPRDAALVGVGGGAEWGGRRGASVLRCLQY